MSGNSNQTSNKKFCPFCHQDKNYKICSGEVMDFTALGGGFICDTCGVENEQEDLGKICQNFICEDCDAITETNPPTDPPIYQTD